MKDSIYTPEESVQIIDKMMQLTRTSIKQNYWYYLFFGILVIIASLGHLVLLKIGFPQASAIWMLMFVGGIIAAVKSARDKSLNNNAQSNQLGLIWLAVGFTYITVIIGTAKINNLEAMLLINPIVFSLAGGATFLSGTIMKFKPLIIGGLLMWLIAIAQLFVGLEIQLILNVVAIVIGYLVPAYMLKYS